MALRGTAAVEFHAAESSVTGFEEGECGMEEGVVDKVFGGEERADGSVKVFLAVEDGNGGGEVFTEPEQFSRKSWVVDDAERGQVGGGGSGSFGCFGVGGRCSAGAGRESMNSVHDVCGPFCEEF